MSPIAPIPEVPEPPRVPRNRGLGALFENSLTRFIVQAFNRVRTALAETLRYAVDTSLETLERPLISLVSPVIDEVLAVPGLPDSFRSMLERAKSGEHQVGVGILAVGAMAAVLQLFPAAMSGLAAKVSQGSFNIFNPNLLTHDQWWRASLLDPGYRKDRLQELAWQGWTERQMEAAQRVSELRPDYGAVLTLWLRGEISDSGLAGRLRQVGVAPEAIEEYKKLVQAIPGPSDLVRFQLREAWRDDVAEKWGYDQGDITQLSAWLSKQGLSADWAKRYWRSHWVIPTVGQGFEMMFREVIAPAELRELLVINDLAPGWIDNLLAIARPVPGRIDRRYAYREGEIGPEELFKLYKADGYDDTWAQVLTNTTIKMAVSETKGLTRSAVQKAYRERRMSRDEAVEMLGSIGIQEDVAGFYLDQEDYDREEELLDLRIGAVEKQFKAGTIPESQAREGLAGLGVRPDEVDARLDLWSTSVKVSVRRPSRSNLDKWFEQGVIGPEQYRERMALLNYPSMDVDLYLASLAVERQEVAEKAEKAARAEQERIRISRIKSDYQVRKAEIDKDVAELQAAIADAQVALVEEQNKRDRLLARAVSVEEEAELEASYRPHFLEADAAIETARLRIQELRTVIAEDQAMSSDVKRSLAVNQDVALQTRLRTERLSLDTEIATLSAKIAGHKTAIARLEREAATAEDADRFVEIAAGLADLQVAIKELQEDQALKSVRREEIDELMLVTLSADRRVELETAVSDLDVEIADWRARIAELQETIREVQIEKSDLESELEGRLLALPGREEQIVIRLASDEKTDEIQRRISLLKANVADLRLRKTALLVEYRSA